jgi:hypothetical protein
MGYGLRVKDKEKKTKTQKDKRLTKCLRKGTFSVRATPMLLLLGCKGRASSTDQDIASNSRYCVGGITAGGRGLKSKAKTKTNTKTQRQETKTRDKDKRQRQRQRHKDGVTSWRRTV